MAKAAKTTSASGQAPAAFQKAFTLERVPGGWSLVTFTIDAATGKTLEVHRTEPDMKALAIEAFKIAAFKYWGSIG